MVIESGANGKNIHAYLNFSNKSQTVSLPENQQMIGVELINGAVFNGSQVKLEPYQVCVLDLVEDDLLEI